MVLSALRGAVGFLSRIPVGHDERGWEAFRRSPVAFPLAGYLVGAIVTAPLLLPVPPLSAAFLFVAWLYLVTGVTHADGLADLGDAAVVHGDASRRREVLKDTTVGVGAVLSLSLVVVGVALAGVALAAAPLAAVGLVVAAEVGAKLGMAFAVCLGTATHEGLASALTSRARPRSFALPLVVALPAAAATWPRPAAAVGLAAALAAAIGVFWWARRRLGGVNGDVFGATNELARVAGLHAGVVAWMRL